MNEIKTLEVGQKINVDGFGLCRVLKLAWDGIITKHYFATTQSGDHIRICWNPLLSSWIQYCQQ